MSDLGYTTVKLPDTVPGVGYTLKHHYCVQKLIEYYCKRVIGKSYGANQIFTEHDYKIMINRGKCHDMDKLLCCLSYPQLMADYFHRMLNGHHEESLIEPDKKSKYDWIEMIFDMESAKYTKKDKQGGGAYAFVIEYKQYLLPYLLPYFQLFKLDKQDTGIIKQIKEEVNKTYYESDLMSAILEYIHTTHLHLLDGVARIDEKGYLAKYGNAVPFRYNSDVYYQRPNTVAKMSNSINRREMIHGTFEASIFDIDNICLIPKSSLSNINTQCLSIVDTLGWEYQR